MTIDILTIFPDMFAPVLGDSIVGRAQAAGHVAVRVHDIRAYSTDKHRRTDDAPYGGGTGMVMTPQPIYDAVQAVKTDHAYVIVTAANGTRFTQRRATELSALDHIIIICGHYEGIDQRAIDLCAHECISIGDYVLTGGEIPAMVIADAVIRLLPGVLPPEATLYESHTDGTLEHPHYTRPAIFQGLAVPDVLLSGNHAHIEAWRKQHSIPAATDQ